MPQGFAIVHNKQILLMGTYGQLHIYAKREVAEFILKDVHADGLPAAEIMVVNIQPIAETPSWAT